MCLPTQGTHQTLPKPERLRPSPYHPILLTPLLHRTETRSLYPFDEVAQRGGPTRSHSEHGR
jgi:hypothetical protein